MLVKNSTPYAVSHKATSRRPPMPEIALIVRGKFIFATDGSLVLPEGRALETQGAISAEIFDSDDDDHSGECLHPSDLAEFKVNAEVMLRGTCHAPNAQPVAQCPVHFALGAWSKSLRVVGPRVWAGDSPSPPQTFTKMPITYSRAYGGKGFATNPIGAGITSKEVPSIEAPGEPIQSRTERYSAAGFGPINATWAPRAEKLGKRRSRYGRRFHTEDFDWKYFQSAPADQQIEGYLKGDEQLTLLNLHPSHATLKTKLPGTRVRGFVKEAGSGFNEVRMVLDTVFVDTDEGAVYLTWRGLTPVRDMALGDVNGIVFASEPFDSTPLPSSHYQAELEALEKDPKRHLDDVLTKEELALVEQAEGLGKPPPPHTGEPLPPEVAERVAKLEPAQQAHLTPTLAKLMQQGKNQGVDLGPHIAASLDRTSGPKKGGGGGLKAVMASLHEKVEEGRWQAAGTDKPMSPAFDDYDKARANPEVAKRLGEPRAGRQPGKGGPEDLAGADLEGRDFSGQDLRGKNLDGAYLRKATLKGTNLEGASLKGAILDSADLTEANLTNANLTEAVLNGANASHAVFAGADLTRTLFNETNLSGANLRGAKGESPIFTKAILEKAALDDASFYKLVANESNLTGATLTKAKLERCVFSKCQLKDAHLDDASLDWTSFIGSTLPGASMLRAHGEHATFSQTDLSGADLRRVSLPWALFNAANAKQTKFAYADLPNAQFFKALLERADLRGCNLLEAKFNSAVINGASFREANLFDSRFTEVVGVGHDFTEARMKKAIVEIVESLDARR